MLLASLSNAEVGLETVKLLIKEGGISSFFTLIFCAILGWQLYGQGLLIKELIAKLSDQEDDKQSDDEATKGFRDTSTLSVHEQVNILNQVLTLLAQHEERLVDFKKTYWNAGLARGDLEERRKFHRPPE